MDQHTEAIEVLEALEARVTRMEKETAFVLGDVARDWPANRDLYSALERAMAGLGDARGITQEWLKQEKELNTD
jgi:hypothetical protein